MARSKSSHVYTQFMALQAYITPHNLERTYGPYVALKATEKYSVEPLEFLPLSACLHTLFIYVLKGLAIVLRGFLRDYATMYFALG